MTGQAALTLISVTAVASKAVLKGRLQANVTLTKFSQKPIHSTKFQSFLQFPKLLLSNVLLLSSAELCAFGFLAFA